MHDVGQDAGVLELLTGAGALVVRDPEPTVLYRQHHGNVMGRNDTPRAILARLGRLGAGDYGTWLRQNVAALQVARDLLEGMLGADRLGFLSPRWADAFLRCC